MSIQPVRMVASICAIVLFFAFLVFEQRSEAITGSGGTAVFAYASIILTAIFLIVFRLMREWRADVSLNRTSLQTVLMA